MTGASSHPPSARELIELHARTLFVHDANDRLLAINDPQRRPPARVFLGWTSHGAIVRARHDLPAALVDRLAAVVSAAPVTDDVARPPPCLAELRAVLATHGPITGEDGGPEYVFPERLAAPVGRATAVTADNAGVLARWLPDWLPDVDAGLPIMTVLVAGDAVAICACARVPGRATHAGVETHPAFRGHGYAAVATAGWARVIRARGIVPLYGTSWNNRASQRVAAKLGLVHYGASLSLT